MFTLNDRIECHAFGMQSSVQLSDEIAAFRTHGLQPMRQLHDECVPIAAIVRQVWKRARLRRASVVVLRDGVRQSICCRASG